MAPFASEPHRPPRDSPASSSQAPTWRLDTQDVTRLLQLMGELVALRNDSRAWRLELLGALTGLLPAAVAAAFVLKISPLHQGPLVAGFFDAGFQVPAERQAFLLEFNAAPFQDPLARHVLESLAATPGSPGQTLTAARGDLFDDAAWNASAHVQQYRLPTGLGDVLVSAQRRCPADSGASPRRTLMVICVYKRQNDPVRFSLRDRTLLDTLHAGLAWLYRAEEANLHLNRASVLSPRLRQTLEFLLAGDTERQVALKMHISAHTVHDYVKALYVHFGVSSRGELLAKWIQSGGHAAPPDQR